jgi:uncharacterized protein (TIRG00374 family)
MRRTPGRSAATVAQPRWRVWLRPLMLLIGVAALAAALREADLGRALGLVTGLGALAFVVLVPRGLWSLAHAGAWRQLLATLGHRLPLARVSADYFAAEAARMTMPGGAAVGESLAAYLIHRGSAVPVSDAVASLAAKKCLVAFTNALLGVLALVVAHDAIMRAQVGALDGPTLFALIAAGTAALFIAATAMAAAMRTRSLAVGATRALARISIASLRAALDRRAHRIAHADRRLARPLERVSALVTPALLLFLQWLLEACLAWLILRLLGVPISPTTALAIEVTTSLLRSLAFFLPSGLGVQDLGYVTMIAAFGSPEAATVGAAFVVLKRFEELVWVGVGYVLLFATRERRLLSAPEVDGA